MATFGQRAMGTSSIASVARDKLRWAVGGKTAGGCLGKRTVWLWPVAFVLVNLVDCVGTWLILSGGGREVAPMMGFLIGAVGLVPAMVVKALAASLLGWTLRRSPGYLAVPSVVIGVVGWLNWGQLLYVWLA